MKHSWYRLNQLAITFGRFHKKKKLSDIKFSMAISFGRFHKKNI